LDAFEVTGFMDHFWILSKLLVYEPFDVIGLWTRWRDYISDLARTRLGVGSAEISEVVVPATSPQEKLVWNWINGLWTNM